jgi:hypothetical protein
VDPTKTTPRHVTLILCFAETCYRELVFFAPSGIYESRSALWNIRGVKRRCTIFHARWARCRSHKKRVRTRYNEHVSLHLVGSSGHVVHSGVSAVRNIDELFSFPVGPDADTTKSLSGHVILNLCFCMQWDLWFTYCILVRPGHETSPQCFSCWGGPSLDPKKSRWDTLC